MKTMHSDGEATRRRWFKAIRAECSARNRSRGVELARADAVVGQREEDDEEGKEVWALYYIDESFDSALDLIDSALLTIERGK